MSDPTREAGGQLDRADLIALLAAQLERRSLPGAMETLAVLLRRNPHDRDALDLRELLDEQLNTLTTGQVGARHRLSRHRGWVNALAFSPDGRRLLSGSGGNLAASGYDDGTDCGLRIWNAERGRALYRCKGYRSAVQAVAWSPDGRRFLAATRRGCLTLWDAVFLTVQRHLQLRGAAVNALAFAPDSHSALAASDDRAVSHWNVRDGRLLRRFEGHAGAVSSVAFSPDGKRALSGSFDRTVRLWDVATGKQIRQLAGHTQLVQSVAFAGPGQALSAGADHTIFLWDLDTGKEIRRFAGHTSRVNSVAFSPEGRFVLSGGADHTVRVWDVTTGRELRCFAGHTDQVLAVAFSPDGIQAASASRDQSLLVWQLPTALETLQEGGAPFNLLEALRDSTLLTPAQLAELAELLPQATDPRALAWHLLDRGWVTAHQINQLILRRPTELFYGPYVVLDRLAQGGMGQVWKGQHRASREVVALKVPRAELMQSAEDARLFWWEHQALTRLSHPNIVAVRHANDAGDRPFIAFEFITGTDLEVLVQQSGPLAPGQACALIQQAALALEHARQRNLIHRDVKPANLIPVQGADAPVAVKVLDWGLADLRPRLAEGSPLSPSEMVGTADYMAPEQANAPEATDTRSDIYSLGCTAYFLLTGQAPFAGCTLPQKLLRHQLKEPKPIEECRPDLPAGLGDVLRKMTAKVPADRYQTPAAVAAALEPYVGGEAPAPQPTERRRSVRQPCQVPVHVRLPLHTSELPALGVAVDVSAGGIQLHSACRHAPGTILALELRPTQGQPDRTLLARVIHVRQVADDAWAMGCAFGRALSADDVRSLTN